jgi:hypothetical protein
MSYVPTTRFNGVGWDKIYRDRYWKKEHFDAIGGHQYFLYQEAPYLFLFWFSERDVWIRNLTSASNFATILSGPSVL